MSKKKKILKKAGIILLGLIAILVITAFIVMRPVKPSLQAGDEIPEINIVDIDGHSFTASGDPAQEKVLLAFFRFAACPVCNVRVHELSDAYERLREEGVEVVAVFESSSETLKTYRQDFHFPFRIISDQEGHLYRAFGVKKRLGQVIRTLTDEQALARVKRGESLYDGNTYEQDGSMTRMTAEFLMQNGKIIRAHYGRHLADHLDLSSI